MSWLDRTGLGRHSFEAQGALLLCATPGEGALPQTVEDLQAAREVSRTTLSSLDFGAGDRAVIALNSDGDAAGTSLALALAPLCGGVASVGPRGRMRLHASLTAIGANTLVITPTGAMDLLARLYLEFNVDPMDLELERILLVGEIASKGTAHRLASEFEADVTQLYCDPFFGVALAHETAGRVEVCAPDAIDLAELARDLETGQKLSEPACAAAEIVVRPFWSRTFEGLVLRTGQVRAPDVEADPGAFNRTVGEHLLVRGRWLSLPLLRKALRSVEGIAGWTLEIDRSEGTLDRARLTLGFERESLIGNPMWEGRLAEAVASVTPVAIEVGGRLDPEPAAREVIDDHRGHHLGVDRGAAGGASHGTP